MKNLIIATDKDTEFGAFSAEAFTFTANIDKKILAQNNCLIVIYENQGQTDDLDLIRDDIGSYEGSKIVLYHGVNLGLSNSFNVFTGGVSEDNATDDRKKYKVLLDAADKWSVFEEIWDYFEKNQITNLERKKCDFLYAIYNGRKEDVLKNGLPDFVNQVMDTVGVSVKYLAENKYDSSIDTIDKKELTAEKIKQGETQRKHLTILRDAILNE